jgi:hypothetical protein
METALGVAQHPQPVTLAILKGDDPVPVEEEAASDAYFVTDLGRNDAAIKSMNDYQPGVKVRCSPSTPSRTGRSSSLRAGAAGT